MLRLKMKFALVLCSLISLSFGSTDDYKAFRNGLQELIETGEAPESFKDVSKNYQLKFDFDGGFYMENIIGNLTCDLCAKTAQTFLALRRKWHASNDILASLLVKICSTLHLQQKDVCVGILKPQVDVLVYIIDNKPDLTPDKICALLTINFGCYDPYAFFNWTVPIPSKTYLDQKPRVPKKSGSFNILQITDIHFDPLYTPGANSKCGKPLCCQNDQTDVKNPEDACGFWSDYRNADVPLHTVAELLKQTKKHSFDMVYFTGDIVSHRVWSTSVESNTHNEKVLRKLFKEFYNVPIYHVLGNHEPHPLNFYSFQNISNKSLSSEWVCNILAEDVSQLYPKEAVETISRGGFYTILIKPGFRIVVLNNNICQYLDIWLLMGDVDPYDQLKWLVNVLLEAERNGEKVHLLHHVPTGTKNCIPVWSREYARIVSRFADTIAAQFNGHTHLDEFFLYFNTSQDERSSEVVNVAFNGASVSTFVNINPSYKVYEIDSDTLEVLDIEEWTFNLTLANSDPKQPLKWYKLYNFREKFGLSSLKPKEMGNLVNTMAKDRQLLKDFIRYKYRLGNGMNTPCDSDCEKDHLCRIVTSVPSDRIKCNEIKTLYDSYNIF